MRFFTKVKDGGPKSPVDAYVLIEIKLLFSIMLLRFNHGQREAYHSHAFNALTWFICGDMWEQTQSDKPQHVGMKEYYRSLIPKFTPRNLIHKVISHGTSWCFTIRGPWEDQWIEHDSSGITTLTHGRKIVKHESW